MQLFFFPTSASHIIKVAGGVGLSLAGVAAKARAAQTVAVNRGAARESFLVSIPLLISFYRLLR